MMCAVLMSVNFCSSIIIIIVIIIIIPRKLKAERSRIQCQSHVARDQLANPSATQHIEPLSIYITSYLSAEGGWQRPSSYLA
jgi:hypothetical protein